MNISFKQGNPQKQPTFGEVAINQFFVDRDGDLCQKYDQVGYQTIATSSGRPATFRCGADDSDKIKRILPKVDRIEF